MQTKSLAAPQKKIILAADAFDLCPGLVHRVARRLHHLYGHATPTVQPVFILTPDATSRPLRWFDEVAPILKTVAEGNLLALLQENSDLKFAKPEVIVDGRRSLSVVVDRMNEYALRTDAGLVVIPTTPKNPLRRLFFPSFSESMLQHSLVPILTIVPDVDSELGERVDKARKAI